MKKVNLALKLLIVLSPCIQSIYATNSYNTPSLQPTAEKQTKLSEFKNPKDCPLPEFEYPSNQPSQFNSIFHSIGFSKIGATDIEKSILKSVQQENNKQQEEGEYEYDK